MAATAYSVRHAFTDTHGYRQAVDEQKRPGVRSTWYVMNVLGGYNEKVKVKASTALYRVSIGPLLVYPLDINGIFISIFCSQGVRVLLWRSSTVGVD